MRTAFEACIHAGDVAVFPADTVYGLACDPENPAAVDRLYALKGRPPAKPAAVMFFSLQYLPPIPERALKLLPGPVTVLVPNPARLFPLACGPTPEVLGVRVPAGSPLAGARVAVLQSSANHSGGADPKTLDEVPEDIVRGAKLVLGAGPLPGTPSTVVDLTVDPWRIVREGAVTAAEVASRLAS